MSPCPAYLEYFERLLRFDRKGAIEVVEEHLAAGGVESLYVDLLMPAMVHTGEAWETDRISVADEHYISEVTRDLIRQVGLRLAPHAAEGQARPEFSAVACCAPGERHGLGLMMICDMLRAAGIEVHFLGEDTPIDGTVDILRRTESRLLCVSCSLEIHLHEASSLLREARKSRPGLIVLVGGAAFDGRAERALAMGADHFAADARQLRELIPRILNAGGER